MADEPQAVPAPEEEASQDETALEEEATPQAVTGQKKPRASKPRFGQVLNIGGQFWTVQSTEGNRVRVARKIGNAMVEGPSLNMDEFAIASRQPLPKDVAAKGSAFASRGLSLERSVDVPESLGGSARVRAYDAISGDVQMDVPGRGPVWVSKNTVQNLVLPEGDRETAATALADVVAGRAPTTEPKPVPRQTATAEPPAPATPVVAAPLPAAVSAAATPVSEAAKSAQESAAEVTEEIPPEVSPPSTAAATPATSTVRTTRTVPVGEAPTAAKKRSVKVTAKAAGRAPKEPSIRETRVQLKTQIERAKSVPSPAGIKATVSAPAASATPAAAALGVAGAALGAITAGAVQASPAAAIEQQALYAKAMHALDVVSSRAAEKRGSIRDLQSQADSLRREVSGLNAQAAAPATGGAYRTPDVSGRIQQVSTQLGNVQNKLAMARYGLQTDEAQAQQLRISTNLMRNAAPEVQRGQLPPSIVGLVAQSIPPDVPDPSPARAAALVATLQPGVTAPPPAASVVPASEPVTALTAPAPRSYATAAPAAAERPVPAATTGLPESVRARLSRGALTLPQATAVAFSASQQADRAAGGGYQEGVGSPDAREAAFATEGAGARPVIDTVQKSYSDPEAPDEAEDLFSAGGEGASADFMRQQQEALERQEQFQPGTTGGPEATTFIPETERAQRVRPGEEGPDEDALRAAKFQADSARAKAAALQAFDVEQEEEATSAVQRVEKLRGQVESTRRNFSRLIDLFNTAVGAATSETVIGAIIEFGAVLLNMNGRMFVALITYRNKKSVIRKIFPPAQFPVEIAFIVAADFLIFSILFVSFCLMMAPFIILFVLATAGIGGIIFGIVSATGS